MNSSGMPPVSRNRICSGDCLSMLKLNLKPLGSTSWMLTSTEASDSKTDDGTGTAMIGPIISVS